MRYYFDINICIVTTVSGASDTLTRRATLRLQLVLLKDLPNISIFSLNLAKYRIEGKYPVSYTHLRAHETRGQSRMPSSA